MQKIFISGGAGFIGTNLLNYLTKDIGINVCNFDKLTYAGNPESMNFIKESGRARIEIEDICNTEKLTDVLCEYNPDAVMHLAAESHVDRSIDGPAEFIKTNIVGTFSMLQASRKYYEGLKGVKRNQFRFLHVSTDEVYGSLGKTGAFKETMPYNPRSPYSASKAASDHLVRAWYETYGLPVLITNCSNNYGPYQFPEKLIPVVILNAITGEKIPVYGKGDNVRDWLYVRDHCVALWTVLKKGKIGQTFNIGGQNERTNIDLVRDICNTLDRLHPKSNGVLYRDQISFVADRPGHDYRYAMDITKIRNELGWSPKENNKSGLEKTVQWYLDNKSWWQQILEGSYLIERQGCISS